MKTKQSAVSPREESAEIVDQWARDLLNGANEFDTDGSMYRMVGVVRTIARDVRAGRIIGAPIRQKA